MKKTILALSLVVAISTLFSSCSKDDEETFVATNMTGVTVIQGVITHEDYNSGNEIGLAGAVVTVRIPNAQLYPNSPNAQGSRTYSGTSDENGNYSVSVTSNGEGVQGTITYSPVTLTVNPVTGEQQTYSSSGQTNMTFYAGVPVSHDRFYDNSTSVDISNIVVGTAIVRGKIEIQHWVQQNSIDSEFYMLENFPLANHTVTLIYDQDPTTLVERSYEVMTDANGDYAFTVETADYDYDLDNDYTVHLPNFDSAQDSIMFNGVTLSSTPGVFLEEEESGSVQSGDIINAVDLVHNTFIAD